MTHRSRLSLRTPLAVLIAMGTALATHSYTLSLPFIWDDVLHYEWLDRVSLVEVWQRPLEGLNYFRPLPFTIWKLIWLQLGDHTPALYHGINVVLHALNSGCVAVLAARYAPRRRWLTGAMAGALFATFPFSFQAIAPVNSLTHPLHTGLILVALLLHDVARPRRARTFASALAAFFAVMAHENGILTAAIVTLAAGLRASDKSFVAAVKTTGVHWVAVTAGFLLWQSVPRPGVANAISMQPSADQLLNIAYFVQGLTFPVAPFGIYAKRALGLQHDGLAIALIAAPMIGLWLFWCRRDALRPCALGLGWFALAALPASLLLTFQYLIEAPRLLYLSSAGAAIFLSAPIAAGVNKSRALLAVLIALAATAWGWRYNEQRATLYRHMDRSIEQLVMRIEERHGQACRISDKPVVVNFPEWFFVTENAYLIGHDGLKTVAENRPLDDLYAVNFGRKPGLHAAILPDIQTAGQPYKSLGEAHTVDSIHTLLAGRGRALITRWHSNGTLVIDDAGCRIDLPRQVGKGTAFGGSVTLHQAAIARARDSVAVDLIWSAKTSLTQEATVFVQLLDTSGKVVAQADGQPVGGLAPLRLWQPGDAWLDKRTMRIDAPLGEGPLHVLIGLYTPANGARLIATGPSGQWPDDAVSLPVPTP
jgi:hypothetical protein